MLNLNDELNKLKELEYVFNGAITKVQTELNKLDTADSKVVSSFTEELQDVLKNGKDVDGLLKKAKDYESNK